MNTQTVYFDDSTICYYLLDYISNSLTIYISSLKIAIKAMDLNFNSVYIIGGKIHPNTYGVSYTFDSNLMSTMNFDLCFFGVRSISADGKITDNNYEKEIAKGSIISNSKKAIALVDDEKVGRESFYNYTPEKFTIVTNSKKLNQKK